MPEITAAESAGGGGDNEPLIEKLQSMNVDDGFSNTSTSPVNTLSICANCGKEGSDRDMNTCNKCNSVKYCNAACKKKHRSKHKKKCERRVAELHDEKIFNQPPPPMGDCPICFHLLPILNTGRGYYSCCGKTICSGCIHAVALRDDEEKCPFCRTPAPTTDEELIKRNEKRIEAKDAMAIYGLGCVYSEGKLGLRQNYAKALELFHRAAELGHYGAYHNIGFAYIDGRGVQEDIKKARHYWEISAMGGNARSRFGLGLIEQNKGNVDRALKHYMIAARGGESDSLESTQALFKDGRATKDDYTKALRLYQAYLDEVKSDQRDKAAALVIMTSTIKDHSVDQAVFHRLDWTQKRSNQNTVEILHFIMTT